MGNFIQYGLLIVIECINRVANLFYEFVGEAGFFIIFGTVVSFVVYRLLIKPITGYGVGSDSSKPKKDKKGE